MRESTAQIEQLDSLLGEDAILARLAQLEERVERVEAELRNIQRFGIGISEPDAGRILASLALVFDAAVFSAGDIQRLANHRELASTFAGLDVRRIGILLRQLHRRGANGTSAPYALTRAGRDKAGCMWCVIVTSRMAPAPGSPASS